MRSPMVKAFMDKLNLSREDSQHLRDLIQKDQISEALNYASFYLKGFGINTLYPEYPNFQYVNLGETYKTTLCFTGKSIQIMSWGSYVETHKSLPNDGSNPK